VRKPEVVVIGAGAAGIMAAWNAASLGAQVTLLEKTNRIGTKILVSGGGKCNITHAGPIESVLKAFRQNEARFIRPSCYRFTNEQIVELFTDRGLKVYTRPDGRIFPHGQTAKDVVQILISMLDEAKVHVIKEAAVGRIAKSGNAKWRIEFQHENQTKALEADRVIVCSGGSSYPGTGTTGDGWTWAKELGHKVVKVRAALAPIYTSSSTEVLASRSGVSIRDCILKARQDGKEIARWTGDLLFTHHGISGPCALGISRIVAEQAHIGPISLEVDVIPTQTFEQITAEVLLIASKNPHRTVAGIIEQYLPKSLVDDLMDSVDIPLETVVGKLEKKVRNRLINALKGWDIGLVRTVPLEKGEVVAGGVDLEEVNPQSLESKLHPGLYFCGEILDIAGPVGGYNLQAAFATGFCAAQAAVGPSFNKS